MTSAATLRRRDDALEEIREEAADCRRCELYKDATQTVFGEGPAEADLFFVAEQPGDKEDIAGRPLIGPAGRMFDACLAEAGIVRERCYITNAVKHFRHIQRGKKRLHRRPLTGHVEACRWWLRKEIELVDPRLIVALGATAGQALLGRPVKIGEARGKLLSADAHSLLVTIHPSYLLRLRSRPEFESERALFLKDLAVIAGFSQKRET